MTGTGNPPPKVSRIISFGYTIMSVCDKHIPPMLSPPHKQQFSPTVVKYLTFPSAHHQMVPGIPVCCSNPHFLLLALLTRRRRQLPRWPTRSKPLPYIVHGSLDCLGRPGPSLLVAPLRFTAHPVSVRSRPPSSCSCSYSSIDHVWPDHQTMFS